MSVKSLITASSLVAGLSEGIGESGEVAKVGVSYGFPMVFGGFSMVKSDFGYLCGMIAFLFLAYL